MTDKTNIKVDDNTKLDINIKWFLQIITFTLSLAWGYFELKHEIDELKMNNVKNDEYIRLNSEFRIKWPLGQLGSLPADAEQNLRLNYIDKDLIKINEIIEELQYKSIKRDALDNVNNLNIIDGRNSNN